MSTLSTAPAQGAISVTPSDTANMARTCRGFWVGGAGNVSILHPDGSIAIYTGVPAGTIIPAAGIRVNATGTTATAIVGMI